VIILGGKYRRLDKLTRMLTTATDRFRAADPKNRAERARTGSMQRRLNAARAQEIARLHDAGTPLTVIGAHLDATDPYRRGVPDNRPVRQPWGFQ
jgi:hypothetical protein